MSEDGTDNPAVGAIKFIGDDLLTFDGAGWRPMAAVFDDGRVTGIRNAQKARHPAPGGQPDREEAAAPDGTDGADGAGERGQAGEADGAGQP
jgi:hypothetical protein